MKTVPTAFIQWSLCCSNQSPIACSSANTGGGKYSTCETRASRSTRRHMTMWKHFSKHKWYYRYAWFVNGPLLAPSVLVLFSYHSVLTIVKYNVSKNKVEKRTELWGLLLILLWKYFRWCLKASSECTLTKSVIFWG